MAAGAPDFIYLAQGAGRQKEKENLKVTCPFNMFFQQFHKMFLRT